MRAAALTELPCGSRLGLAAFTGYRSLMLLAPVEVCEYYGDLLATLVLEDDIVALDVPGPDPLQLLAGAIARCTNTRRCPCPIRSLVGG